MDCLVQQFWIGALLSFCRDLRMRLTLQLRNVRLKGDSMHPIPVCSRNTGFGSSRGPNGRSRTE
jgi:hypothetical protein